MKKVGLIILVILAGLILIVFFIRLLTPEDTWICDNGQWIKHGNPKVATPTKPCK